MHPSRNFVFWLLHQSLECYAASHHTLETFYTRLVWSFNALWLGEEPTHDWNGQPIPGAKPGIKLLGGRFMSVWGLIGDLEHICKAYAMPNSTNRDHPCGLCPANCTDLPYWDFRPNAKWIKLIYTAAFWRASGLRKSIIWDITGVSCLSFQPDYMHCKSLGIDKILIGFLKWGSSIKPK